MYGVYIMCIYIYIYIYVYMYIETIMFMVHAILCHV